MPSFIYVIAAKPAGPVKLGISAAPEQRVRQLQTGHAEPLIIFHREPIEDDRVRLYERLLHRDHHTRRLRGEWFDMPVDHAIAYVQFTVIEYDLMPIETLRRHLRG